MNIIPILEYTDGAWKGTIFLPIWKDFDHKQIRYKASNQKPIAEVIISIGGDMFVENQTITPAHVNAYEYLTTHAQEMHDAILTRLWEEYRILQSEYVYDDESAELMPDIENIEQFKHLIRLRSIHILNVSKDNVAYVGYSFDCSWDEEHGLGFMTHKNRIIDLGGADHSFMTWIAERNLKATHD